MANTIKTWQLTAAITLTLIIGFIGGYTLTPDKIQTINQTIAPPITCPTCQICQESKQCPTCPTCQKCDSKGCPAINPPSCPTTNIITPALEKELLNLPKNLMGSMSPAVQHGCYKCMQATWELLELSNRPKFFPGPTSNDLLGQVSGIYTQGQTKEKNPGQYTFNYFIQNGNQCFNISQYPDENDRKRWTWNKESCASSTITICHI